MKRKIEKLQEAIKKSDLDEKEKSEALEHIRQWYIQDKAEGIIGEELKKRLLAISAKIEPILAELGFL